MLFQLRELNETEQQTVIEGPIWVGILIAGADAKMEAKELNRIEEIIRTKTYSEGNDLNYLYTHLANDQLSDKIAGLVVGLDGTATEMSQKASDKLTELNSILPKLNSTYAKQYRESLQEIAVSVAQAAGGILGMGSINREEKDLIDLPMINHI